MSNHDPARSGSELVSVSTGRRLLHGEITRPLVVFVHGFTAHGEYLLEHARQLPKKEYCAVLFNYDSYVGIDHAAEELAAHLREHKVIIEHGVFFVAHSMGGLVTRYCVVNSLGELASCVRGVVLLGTPNEGTLNNGWMLARFLDLGDRLTKITPYTRLATCRAAQQLTLADKDRLIKTLNVNQQRRTPAFPTLTISGGLNHLEIGEKPNLFVDWLGNKMIQRALKHAQNDGLVPEASVDLTRVFEKKYGFKHTTDYKGYGDTNHSALACRQLVSYRILHFLQDPSS